MRRRGVVTGLRYRDGGAVLMIALDVADRHGGEAQRPMGAPTRALVDGTFASNRMGVAVDDAGHRTIVTIGPVGALPRRADA